MGQSQPLERARVLGYLAGIATKVIEAKDLQARVEALELVLKRAQGQGRDDDERCADELLLR